MVNGTVKFYNPEKRFGFINGDDGKEYFVHETTLKEGVSITEGDRVVFDSEQGDKGLKAINVSKEEANNSEEEVSASEE